MAIDAVVFDFGRVLIGWDPAAMYDAAIGPEARRRLFAEVDLAAMNDRVDLGADLGAEIEALAAAHPRWAAEIRLWRDRWLDMARPAIDHSVRLLRALRARAVPTFGLSNFGVQTLDMAERHYPFLREFDARFISGQLGVMKPDPAIYAHLEAATGIAPARLLFTDDRPDNIAAARARNWQVHLFDGPAGLAARLVAEGLLSEAEARP